MKAPRTLETVLALALATIGGAASGDDKGYLDGYVADSACAGCHPDLFASFQEVAMARSFYRPRRAEAIEDFAGGRYVHEPSGRIYEMGWEGERLMFKRYKKGADGRPTEVFEQQVDWILGSGNHTRTYLYRTPNGGLYQLPLAWYSQPQRWAMAPGFERGNHLGVERLVRRECLFCHNAYPDVPAGSDLRQADHTYPTELPEGIGCQRCHGPGAEHVRLGRSEPVDFQRLNAAIVNPARLAHDRRDGICNSCHLQPTATLPGIRRFGRGTYSFRPGEDLTDYLVPIDVDQEGQERWERFEINHHPYRLRQSRCVLESEPGKLGCLTCHDPHRKLARAERAAHYRAACLGCHQLEDCKLDAMTAEGESAPAVAADDCVACHMPQRRTQDVIEVVMTDHFIRRRPGGEELVAPLPKREPVITNVTLDNPPRDLRGPIGEVYRTAALLRATGGAHRAAVDRLTQLLEKIALPSDEPYLDLAQGQIKQHRFAAAEATLLAVLERSPDELLAADWLSIVQVAQGRGEEAIAGLRTLLAKKPDRAEARFNLGRILLGYDRPAEALPELRRAVALRPNLTAAWYQLGAAHAALGQRDEAAQAYRRCLAINPDYRDAAAKLAELAARDGGSESR